MDKQFQTVVSAKHKLFDLHLRETFHYRDLIMLFVKRDFTALYKQTVLGPLWAVIQPLLTTVAFTVIFGNLAKLPVTDSVAGGRIPSFLFYLAGTVVWSYFSNVLTNTSNTFRNNRHTMGKVYYPRLASPVASSISGLISFGIQLALLVAIWGYYLIRGGWDLAVTPRLFLLPLVILQMIMLSVGCGIILSSLTTKYRDLAMLIAFGLQLWQYASPVAYGLTMIPETYRTVYLLNPTASLLLTFRYALFGVGYFDFGFYLISWAVTIGVFFVGLMLFSRIERTFMDTI